MKKPKKQPKPQLDMFGVTSKIELLNRNSNACKSSKPLRDRVFHCFFRQFNKTYIWVLFPWGTKEKSRRIKGEQIFIDEKDYENYRINSGFCQLNRHFIPNTKSNDKN